MLNKFSIKKIKFVMKELSIEKMELVNGGGCGAS
jgi:bacteriocin-like protein